MSRLERDLSELEVLDDEMVRILRAMTGEERMKMANDIFKLARCLIARHIAAEHPGWSQEEVQWETFLTFEEGAVCPLDPSKPAELRP